MKHKFKRCCKDYKNIENYEKAKKDNFVGWCCHHRLETHNSDGEKRLVDITVEELIALGMYYNRPASELIFMTRADHASLHQKGKVTSEESKKKMSEAKKEKYIGEKNPFYGKQHTEETKKINAEAHKGNTNTKGMHWYNNGEINKLCYECPEGFVPGMLRH